jgi:hypothetical protein
MHTVDDHFAKALGETWFKLKKSSNNDLKRDDYISNGSSYAF